MLDKNIPSSPLNSPDRRQEGQPEGRTSRLFEQSDTLFDLKDCTPTADMVAARYEEQINQGRPGVNALRDICAASPEEDYGPVLSRIASARYEQFQKGWRAFTEAQADRSIPEDTLLDPPVAPFPTGNDLGS